jgi:hypothetical protein
MPSTYEPIATQTLGSAAANISFTSIPSSYTNLVIVTNARGATGGHLYARWGNGSYDSGTNYSNTGLFARSTTNDYGSERNSNFAYARLSPFTYAVPSAASTFGTVVTHLQNYSNTTTYKTALTRCSGVGATDYAGTETDVILWRSTSAINQIQFTIAGGFNFETGTTITLYGIKAA